MAKILIVDDDNSLRSLMGDWLCSEQHTVESVANGTDGLDRLKFFFYDVVVLDWELPDLPGIEVCKQFRLHGGVTPILMLTGRGSLADKVNGFDSGVDDYLTKPFNMKELSVRLRALLRRPPTLQGAKLTAGNLELDSNTSTLRKDGKTIELLPREFALLEFLMRHPERYFNTDTLLNRVWSSESDVTPEALRQCLKRLRAKIDDPGASSSIKHTHGLGYKIQAENNT